MWSEYLFESNRLDAIRIGIAVLISVFLHTLWFGLVQVQLPTLVESDVPLSVRLINTPLSTPDIKPEPSVILTPKTIVKKKQTPNNIEKQVSPIEPDLTNVSEKPKESESQSMSSMGDVPNSESTVLSAEEKTAPLSDAIAYDTSGASNKANLLSNETSTSEGLVLPQEPQLPKDAEKLPPYRKVNMLFDVIRGPQQGRIGTASITYEAQPELGTYILKSIMEPDFIASLIVRGSLVQTSEGKITEKGLQPHKYEYKFGDVKDKQYLAEFNWSDLQVTMKTVKGEKTVDMTSGTQDLLSFLLQFMFVPPLEDMHIALTTGRKFKEYHYQFVGEDSLNLKAGQFRSIHIVNTSLDEKERTELWLAIDYNYLPVKMSKTEKDGASTEQVLTDFNASY